jgi:N-acetylglucosamine-6-phosphate deacetylase
VNGTLQLRGRAFVNGRFQDDQVIVWVDGRIVSVDPAGPQTGVEPEPPDHVIVPAFIDVHVHGGVGHDFADGDVGAVTAAARFHASEGTGALAATIVSSPPAETIRAIHSIVEAARSLPPDAAEIVAIHLEGPFLAPSRRGAQNPGSLRGIDPEEPARWLAAAEGLPLLVTLAPEIDGAIDLIRRHHEIRFALGHTDADYGTTVRAFEAGASHVTHLFNAMPPLHHRMPGVVGAALLSSGVTIELIADGIHLHPAILQLVARTMPDRVVLVTDAMRAAGSEGSTHLLGGLTVHVDRGAARLEDGTLAGSTLTAREAVCNMVEQAGVPLRSVIPMMSSIPARIAGVSGSKGRIARDFDADLLVIDKRFRIRRRFLRGREL